jgi:hypothetical protein
LTDTATVSITVTPVNDAPVAVNDTASTNEDTEVTKDVISNDTDVDNTNAQLSIKPGSLVATNGIAWIDIDGRTIHFTPDANKNDGNTPGGFKVTYKATDGSADSNVATLTISVTAVNDAPVALNDAFATNEDTTLNVPAPGVLGNDSDVDGDSLTAQLVTGPLHGTLTLNANGSFTYAPNLNYFGADQFSYRAKDPSNAQSNLAIVSLTITPVNDKPVLTVTPAEVTAQYSDLITTVTITATDVDNPGTELTFSVRNNTDSGSGTLPSDLILTDGVHNVTTPGMAAATITGRVNVSASDYLRYIRVTDASNAYDSKPFTLHAQRENAEVTEFAPAAIQTDGTDNDLDTLTVTMTVKEPFDGFYSKTLNSGSGLANAQPITVTLTPVGTGSSYSCTATNTHYDPNTASNLDTATASCTIFNVAPNVYDTIATIGGNYFLGGGEGVITVYNPALGFTTGGGWYTADNGDRVNFGFNVKYLKSGNIQGSLMAVARHDGKIYTLKSNAMGALAVNKDTLGGWYYATFNGKATYAVPPSDPLLSCGARKCGDYKFTVYVEDRQEPGSGYDRFWVQVVPPAGGAPVIASFFMPSGAAINAKTIEGGNIQVPQPQSGVK